MKLCKALVMVTLFFSPQLWAAPPIWDTNFGPALGALTGEDDEQTSVTLSFPFPFAGSNYTTVYVGTNGDIQLGGLGDDADIDYDHWEYMEEFIADLAPSLAAFNTDLDLTSTGTVHFRDAGNKAVFTWNEVGTNQNETALNTFQIQIFPSGVIVFGYNGILDGAGEDLLGDLDEGIVVGITTGAWPDNGTEPGLTDLSSPIQVLSPHIYDRWCYDTANSCGFNGNDNGLPGPVNTAFDLDQRNVVFTPTGRGFAVSPTLGSSGPAETIPALGQWGLLLLALALGIVGISQRKLFTAR